MHLFSLQQLRQEFQATLAKTASSTSMSARPDEPEGEDTGANSPPKVTRTYTQHRADYVCLFIKEGHMLTMDKDQSAPLITEVCIFYIFNDHAFIHFSPWTVL